MSLLWPSFTTWNRIREEDRGAVSEVLAELLAHGALIGDTGRDRELYLLAREYQAELSEYLAPLHVELHADPDQPVIYARPMPADCALMARFNKAETLVVLALWRLYHDARMQSVSSAVIVSANDLWERLKLYFEKINPPTEGHLREMLAKLRARRLVRVQWSEDAARFGESQIEILPTLARVIPFEDPGAWEQQAAMYRQTAADAPQEETS